MLGGCATYSDKMEKAATIVAAGLTATADATNHAIVDTNLVSLAAIDNAAEDFGMPMGPFALLDQVGVDLGADEFGDRRECEGVGGA